MVRCEELSGDYTKLNFIYSQLYMIYLVKINIRVDAAGTVDAMHHVHTHGYMHTRLH